MERDLGAEIVRAFGARLRRIYEQEEQGLPAQMAVALDRLRRAEQDVVGAVTPSVVRSDDSGPISFTSSIVSATR
jgi:hypothetical protein